jgi:hypothetical protein
LLYRFFAVFFRVLVFLVERAGDFLAAFFFVGMIGLVSSACAPWSCAGSWWSSSSGWQSSFSLLPSSLAPYHLL